MVLAAFILISSTALFFFFLQAACQRALNTRFEQEYCRSIVNANRLELLSLRKELDEYGHAVDYGRLRMTLKRHSLARTYLLKTAANVTQSYSRAESLL